jgi:hypothetical protein
MTSDPEESEEATPLVIEDGSPPSIAAKAALFEVPPLLEFSPKRAVPALSSVDISPWGGGASNNSLSFFAPHLAPRADYG